jgi:hypothetical protein
MDVLLSSVILAGPDCAIWAEASSDWTASTKAAATPASAIAETVAN